MSIRSQQYLIARDYSISICLEVKEWLTVIWIAVNDNLNYVDVSQFNKTIIIIIIIMITLRHTYFFLQSLGGGTLLSLDPGPKGVSNL